MNELEQLRRELAEARAEAGVVTIPEPGVSPDKWERIGIHGVELLRAQLRDLTDQLAARDGVIAAVSGQEPKYKGSRFLPVAIFDAAASANEGRAMG
jgi:hypothetical protein